MHRDGPADGEPVLVLHGWSDYVFDRPLLERLAARGHDVWALDLRKHGRSLRPGQTPTAIDSLLDLDDEIGAALTVIGRHRPPVLVAHSTGGLVAALWAARYPWSIRGLVLNSPWLDMHLTTWLGRVARRPVARLARPGRALPRGWSHYARTVHRDYGGTYDFDLEWKPARGHPLPLSTLGAVLEAQHLLRHAPAITLPTLVLHSDRSLLGPRFREGMRRADTVLDVRTLARAARRLGPQVQVEAIPGARHDVFLSESAVRERAIRRVETFLDGLSAPGAAASAR
ncbi:alpha/beta hydrolase [Brachybacterium sillae]|uniref:alpha/beta hydrolase n=1 Tax=Brachybacterium sillae TaxID=2810536 RepID=UPI00217E4ECC|nr:alpha/beta hydrolase [Brachybacterium sillae]